jgi:hypothetical protein
MSSSLPPEILDLIVDHLHDEPTALKLCCVVSKSWIQRTLKHLFACVEFSAPQSHIEPWKKAFLDPSNSPAHHTRSLSICDIPSVTASDAGGWIRLFKNLVCLQLESRDWEACLPSLVPFHGLSPALRSLSLRASPRGSGSYLFPSPSRGSHADFRPPRERCVEHSFDLTQTHRVPRPEGHRRYPPYPTSIVGPPGWSPLHQDHDIVSP